MKKLIYPLALLFLGLGLEAQQIPLYSNYFFTPYIYNPSLSGASGFTEMALMHRRQWADVQGSPETNALGINGSLNEEKVGWSVYAFNDVTDIVSRVGVYGNYAYHLNLTDNAKLSFGLGAGYLNNQIDQNAIRSQDNEAIISVTTNNRGTFDINAGLNLRIADFQVGFAAPQLLGQSITYTENTAQDVNYSLLRHYVATASYDFKFSGDKYVLNPILMVKAAKNVPVQVDAGLLFNMKEYGYVGAMYRSDYAVTANIGINLTEYLTFGYAHDFSLNDFGPQLGTSNEFMLAFRFGSNKRNERIENKLKKLDKRQRGIPDEVEELVNEKLDEFKDQYKQDIEQQISEAQQNNPPAGGDNTGNPGRQGNPNDQQGNPGFNNDPNQGNPTNQGDQGTGGFNNNDNNRGFDPQNQASNVQPGSPGYYIVAGVFGNRQNANKLVNNLANQGLNARIFQSDENNYYYVYLLKFNSSGPARSAKASNLNGTYSGEIWIKKYKVN